MAESLPRRPESTLVPTALTAPLFRERAPTGVLESLRGTQSDEKKGFPSSRKGARVAAPVPPRKFGLRTHLLAPRSLWLAGAGCALVLLACAWLFPAGAAAGFAALGIVAFAGAGIGVRTAVISEAFDRFAHRLPGWSGDAVVLLVVSIGAAVLFADSWNRTPLALYDWGPHHANLVHLIDGLRHGHVPRWVLGVSTGDSPYELYPVLFYQLAAMGPIVFGTDPATSMLRTAILIHTLAAVSAGWLARRCVSTAGACVVSLVMVFDYGSVFGGGIDGLFGLGVAHSALANAISPLALLSVVAALRRPCLRHAVCIWLTVSVSVIAHPLGLVAALAIVFALSITALVAEDVAWPRAATAILHVGLGVAVAACLWMPLGQRLVLYAVHFALGGRVAWEHFAAWLTASTPEATIGPLVYAGYLGALVGLWSRKAVPTLLASFVGILFAGLTDQLYVLLDLAPSLSTSRFSTVRLASVAKASVYILGLYACGRAVAAVRPLAASRKPFGLAIMGALLALSLAAGLRGAVPHFDRLASDLRGLTHREVPDPEGMKALAEWAAQQNVEMKPGTYARLLHEDNRRFYSVYHVYALGRLPTLWVGPVSCLFARERIEDSSVESFKRFNVRWVMRRDESPSIGTYESQLQFGRYRVREYDGWDGQFARIERGEGEVVVHRLEDERIEIELRGTDTAALVALGTGYYPRWEATHEEHGAVPVYPMPAIPEGRLHVLAAWVPPGRTTFTPTATLPSDRRGLGFSLAALLSMVGVVVTARGRLQRRLLRRAVVTMRWAWPHRGSWLVGAAALMSVGLLIAAVASSRGSSRALQLGNGLFGGADVTAGPSETSLRSCPYSVLHGGYRCAGPLLVQDTMANLLNDAPPSPPFAVPAILISAKRAENHVNIHLDTHLHGEYWAVTQGGPVTLHAGTQVHQLGEQQSTLVFDVPVTEVSLSAVVPTDRQITIALVRRDRIDPDRGYPVLPANNPW